MGYTALNDAIGGTIAAIDAGDYAKGRKVLVVVMTDGRENASKEWTSRAAIAKLVQRKEDPGWKFVFFGANIDAFAEGESLSIPALHPCSTKGHLIKRRGPMALGSPQVR